MTSPSKRLPKMGYDNTYSRFSPTSSRKKPARENIMDFVWAPIPILSSNPNRGSGEDVSPAMGLSLAGLVKKSIMTKKNEIKQDAAGENIAEEHITEGRIAQERVAGDISEVDTICEGTVVGGRIIGERTAEDISDMDITATYEGEIVKLISADDLNMAQMEQLGIMCVMMESLITHSGPEDTRGLEFGTGSLQDFQKDESYMEKLEAIVQVDNYHITKVFMEDGRLCLVISPDIPDLSSSSFNKLDTEASSTSTTPIAAVGARRSGISIPGIDTQAMCGQIVEQPATVSSSVLDDFDRSDTHSSESEHDRFWWSPDGSERMIDQPGAATGSWLHNRNVRGLPVLARPSSKNPSVFTRPPTSLPTADDALPRMRKDQNVVNEPGGCAERVGTVVKKLPHLGFRPKRRADVGVATRAQLDSIWGTGGRAPSLAVNQAGETSAHVGNTRIHEENTAEAIPAAGGKSRPNNRIFLTAISDSNRAVSWEAVEAPVQSSQTPRKGIFRDADESVSMDVLGLRNTTMGTLVYNPGRFTSLSNLRRHSSVQFLGASRVQPNPPSAESQRPIEQSTGIPSPIGNVSHNPRQSRSHKLWADLNAARNVDNDDDDDEATTPQMSPETPDLQRYRTMLLPTGGYRAAAGAVSPESGSDGYVCESHQEWP